jgi:uncharacterized membrane protein YgcG
MKFVKWIFISLFCLPFILAIGASCFNSCTEEGCNPVDYARITDVEYKAVVVDEPGSMGKIVVTERLTFDIHAFSRNNLFWELWRDLCEDDIDGAEVRYKVNSVKQILEDGTEIEYEKSPKLYWDDYDYVKENPIYGPGKWFHSPGPYNEEMERYECVFFYVDGIYREEVVFEIEYEMYNAALRYGDCSDLYISMFSEDAVNDLESFKAQILFPEKDMPSPGNYIFTTYGTDSHTFPVEESDTINPGYHTFLIELDEDDLSFKPYNEYIEFDLVAFGTDKHIFTEHASYNDYYNDPALEEILCEQDDYTKLPEKYKVPKAIIFIVLMALSGLVLFYCLTRKHKIASKHLFFKPMVDYQHFRDIPGDLDPKFAAELVFCKDKKNKKVNDDDVYAALMLSLVRKGYIEIVDHGNDNVYIEIKKCPSKEPQRAVLADGVTETYNTTAYTNMNSFDTGNSFNSFNNFDNVTSYNNMNSFNNGSSYNSMNSFNSSNYNGVDDTLVGNSYTGIDLTHDPMLSTSFNNSFNNGLGSSTAPFSYSSILTPQNSDLTENEAHYFNLIVHHATGRIITMKDLRAGIIDDYTDTDKFVKNVESSVVNIGIEQGYFQKSDYKQVRKSLYSTAGLYKFLGLLSLILINIISCSSRLDFAYGAYTIFGITCLFASYYLKRIGRKYILLTQFGEDEYAKWRGLYNFLNSSTLINERTHIELPLWEKYLVYATAFGLSTKVSKAISVRCPEYSTSKMLSNDYYRSNRIRHSSRSVGRSVRSGSSIARGGGGYGGGGRGGGGGGGGH